MTTGEIKSTAAFGLLCLCGGGGGGFGVVFFPQKRLNRVSTRFSKMRENKAKSLI